MTTPSTGTPQPEEASNRNRLAEVIWTASRADEGTISATGANKVADAVLASEWLSNRDAATRAEALQAVTAVLVEWGALSADESPASDDDFAEAIHDSGAWRLARDLRAALDLTGSSEPSPLLPNDTCGLCGGAFGSREDAVEHLRIDHQVSLPSDASGGETVTEQQDIEPEDEKVRPGRLFEHCAITTGYVGPDGPEAAIFEITEVTEDGKVYYGPAQRGMSTKATLWIWEHQFERDVLGSWLGDRHASNSGTGERP